MRWWVLAAAAAALLPLASACDCCARNATETECAPGAGLRGRWDCPCCSVCAAQKGDECNDTDKPCADKLDCGPDNVCIDQKKCRSDGECASDRFCLGGVCFNPCFLLDPCNDSLKNGVCRVRNHRPVCSCPEGFTFDTAASACTRVGCKNDDGKIVDIGERIFRKSCEETCVCGPTGEFNCTQTVCPPGFYRSGAFDDDPFCVELRSSTADGCCVNVVCSESLVPAARNEVGGDPDAEDDESVLGSTVPTTNEPESTTVPTTSTTTSEVPEATSIAARSKLPDMLPVETTHNATTLLLPSVGGQLSYSSEGRPLVPVALQTGQRQQTVTGLLPGTSYLFKWKGTEGSKKILRIETNPGCVTNVSSHAIGETYHMGCESTCVCGGPNQPSCRSRCLFKRGTVTDKSCSEQPDIDDPECCVQLRCAVSSTGGRIVDDPEETTTEAETTTVPPTTSPSDEPATSSSTTAPTEPTPTTPPPTPTTTSTTTSEKPAMVDPNDQPKPTLIVTTKSFNSVTLAWDDFKPQTYTHGYVAQYRRSGDDQWKRQSIEPKSGKSVPLVVIKGLQPSTEYQMRVAIYDNKELDTLGETTETIRITTDAGCVEGNSTYPVGGEFTRGCEARCFCGQGGVAECSPLTCLRPLFKSGHFKNDPLCRERQVTACCVTVYCASPPENDPDAEGATGMSMCDSVHCGENYVCEMMKKDADVEGEEDSEVRMLPMCVCPDNFTEVEAAGGEKKCIAVTPDDPSRPDGVEVKLNTTGCMKGNKTYMPGDDFFDGCEYRCTCNEEEEIVCKSRCAIRAVDETTLRPGCELVPDPNDDCCKTLVCATTADTTEGVTSTTPVDPTSGCLHQGKLYSEGETFYSGCESQCTCQPRGEVSCQPRCAPQQETKDPTCRTESDPSDSCCNITVCDSDSTTTTEPSTSGTELPSTTSLSSDQPSRLGAARLETGNADLKIISLEPKDNGKDSTLRLTISESILDSILSAQTQPMLVEWRYPGDVDWRQKVLTIDQIAVESLDTLSMLVPGLEKPEAAAVRVRYGGATSDVVQGSSILKIPNSTEPTTEEVEPLPPPPPVSFETTTSATTSAPEAGQQAQDRQDSWVEELPSAFFDPELGMEGLFPTEEVTDTTTVPSSTTPAPEPTTLTPGGGPCNHNGAVYQPGEEFYDGCRQFCICAGGRATCAAIECPHHFGLSLINPDCLEWDMHQDFVAEPPNCCPEVSCKNDGSCEYEGQRFRNLDEIPQKLTGCEQRCFCEFGNVTCQSECPPVPATPPRDLPCPPGGVTLGPGPNGCCKYWQCSSEVTDRPPVPPMVHPQSPRPEGGIGDLSVRVLDPSAVKFSFSIPPAFVGLPGWISAHYNQTESFGVSPGESDARDTVVRPFYTTSGRLDRPEFSFTLDDLKPAAFYTLQVQVNFDDASTTLESNTVDFETPPLPIPSTTLPPKVPVDAQLEASEIDTTSAMVRWRRLKEQELSYIDGIQLRYRDLDVDAQVWTMTPFIHRELTSYRLTDLKPDTGYEVDIVLMPFQHQNTEMVSERPLTIRTLPVVDPYDFNITLMLREPTMSSVRVEWSGVPQPQYKYVNVYRIVYIYEKEREEKQSFKLAKTSDGPSILLKGLKPSSKYQVWLEAYLKNGKTRVSEVQEFDTKPGELGKAEEIRGEDGDYTSTAGPPVYSYYGGMVAAAIIAALAILVCIILVYMLVRKSNRAKAPITNTRKNGPSYENPAFKRSEMELNGMNGNDRFS